MKLQIQDGTQPPPLESGLNSVTASIRDNADVSISPFKPGTTAAVKVTATKVDTNRSARVELKYVTVRNQTFSYDPVFTTLKINTGRSVTQTFSDIPQNEHFIAVTNGNPGLARLEILFNGHYKAVKLSDNQAITLDMATAMLTAQPSAPGTLTLVGTGPTGASAEVVVSDTPPPAAQPQAKAFSASVAYPDSGTWGPLTKEFEDNSALQIARSAPQQIELHLATALNPATATIPQLYTVQVNNIQVEVRQVVVAQQSPKETTLLLTVPAGTFKVGDVMTVAWERVENAQGQPLVGRVNLVAQ